MKSKKTLIASMVLVLGILIFGYSTAKGKEIEKKPVYQGIIETTEIDLNSKIPGKIGQVLVEEGQEVKEGDTIVVVDSKELYAKKEQLQALTNAAQSQYEAAQSQVEAANSMLDKALNGARDQEVAQAQVYYDLMVTTYERVNRLYEKGAVSAQKRDEVKAQLDIAEQKLNMANEGARTEDISGAQAMVASAVNMSEAARGKYEQAKAGIEEIDVYIQETQIKAPIDGVVTLINVDKGELVSTGMSIGTVSDLNNMWLELNLDERKINEVVEGKMVKIKIPAFEDVDFEGKIVRVNRKPDFAVKKATNDNGNYDIMSYGVKIKISNKDNILRPGMTAIVEFID